MSQSIAQDVDTQWLKLYIPIVAGSVAVLGVIGLLIACTMKRKKKKINPDGDDITKQDSCGM